MKGNGQNINELIRIEAYLLSEKAGHPSHMHDYFWSQAEGIVRQRAAIVDVAVKAASKAKSTKAKPAAATPAKPASAKAKKPAEAQLALGDKPTPATKKPAAAKKAAPGAPKKAAPKSK